jgi:hypothetical protein
MAADGLDLGLATSKNRVRSILPHKLEKQEGVPASFPSYSLTVPERFLTKPLQRLKFFLSSSTDTQKHLLHSFSSF